jgi:chromatin segregation and condensation protein Rec8/ScpA/Scc1 (kleisin family)
VYHKNYVINTYVTTMKTSFRDSIKGAPREEVIVYFLGMLELVKRGVIDAEQDERDGIMLKKVGGGVMHVG